jgi:hypothetical protein
MARTKITADELNQLMPPVQDDDISISGHSADYYKATSGTAGPSLGDVMSAAGSGTEIFNQDPKVLEYYSDAIVEPQPIAYTQRKMNDMLGFAEVNAALASSGVQQFANPQYKEQLKSIVAKAANMPAPDTVVRTGNERIILSPDVTRVPAAFDTSQKREEALDLLTSMIGKEKTVEVISCARSSGVVFVKLPLLWLSQHLAVESKKNETYEDIPTDLPFLDNVDGNLSLPVPQAIAKLFSVDTARNIQLLAKVHRVPMVYVLQYLVDKVCKNRKSVVQSKESDGSKYNDLSPKISDVS